MTRNSENTTQDSPQGRGNSRRSDELLEIEWDLRDFPFFSSAPFADRPFYGLKRRSISSYGIGEWAPYSTSFIL